MYSSQWFLHIVNQWQSIKVIIIQIGKDKKHMNRNRRRHVPRKWPLTDNRAFVSAGVVDS